MPLRLAVLLSGGGTTLQNLLDRIAARTLDAEVVAVISSKPGVRGVERAHAARVPLIDTIDRRGSGSREVFSERIFARCREAHADLVVMAGFLQLVLIPEDFGLRVVNIHPSLIPAFCGQGMHGHHVHEAVLTAGVKVTGCTVHFADNQYDHGPIIAQRAVEVGDDDTPDTLAGRVFAAECELYPEVIALYGQGRLRVTGRRVTIQREA